MIQTVGILAYGSLIDDPGREIAAAIKDVKKGVVTPFNVEFARTSDSRRGAPTLVPVPSHGARGSATILVLDAPLNHAKNWLYRRERDMVGTNVRYRHRANPGPNVIVIGELADFETIGIVLYTKIGANITDLTPPISPALRSRVLADRMMAETGSATCARRRRTESGPRCPMRTSGR